MGGYSLGQSFNCFEGYKTLRSLGYGFGMLANLFLFGAPQALCIYANFQMAKKYPNLGEPGSLEKILDKRK